MTFSPLNICRKSCRISITLCPRLSKHRLALLATRKPSYKEVKLMTKNIPLTLPHFGSAEITAINDLLANPKNILDEKYTKLCRNQLQSYYQTETLVTHSCTAALEMSALLLNINPGDEVILPSYTFVATASAFVLFGAKPVFVDCQKETLNIDPALIESAITTKTKAIVVMHYAAVACDMPLIQQIAKAHDLPIVEDAAQCIGAKYAGRHLGTLGDMGALSFHNTKNVTSGLGGGLIVNNEALMDRAKIIWQKGTNREAFIEGKIDKYTWHDLGSSYMINELGAAILHGQLERLDEITQKRLAIWHKYHTQLIPFEQKFGFRRPIVPEGCDHNAHIYYLIAPGASAAAKLRNHLAQRGITAPAHYVPLHMSPAGRKFSNQSNSLPVCEDLYNRILRLPLWEGMALETDYVLDSLLQYSDIS